MNARYLFPRLVLPLVAASFVCVAISVVVCDPFKSLLINMSAAFLGSIITVFYVDVVLHRHQEVLWREVRSKVFDRVERVTYQMISSVRLAFGISVPPALWSRNASDTALVRRELLRLAETVLLPALPHVEEMGQDDWKQFASNLQGIVQEVDRLITLFSRNLDVDYMNLLLDLQKEVMMILANYSIWPDLLGVPYGAAPPKLDGSSSTPQQRAANDVSAKDIEKVLAICAKLLRQLPTRP